MKIVKKTIFIIILISITSCGYEPIFSKRDGVITPIKSFQIIGDKRINKKIISALNINAKEQVGAYELIINSSKSIETISRDNTGRSSSFKTEITVLVSLMTGDKVHKKQNFASDFIYNNIKSKFDLSQYQQDIEANLIDIIIEEISIFLMLN